MLAASPRAGREEIAAVRRCRSQHEVGDVTWIVRPRTLRGATIAAPARRTLPPAVFEVSVLELAVAGVATRRAGVIFVLEARRRPL